MFKKDQVLLERAYLQINEENREPSRVTRETRLNAFKSLTTANVFRIITGEMNSWGVGSVIKDEYVEGETIEAVIEKREKQWRNMFLYYRDRDTPSHVIFYSKDKTVGCFYVVLNPSDKIICVIDKKNPLYGDEGETALMGVHNTVQEI
jgi:hypothetical protein